MPTISLHSDLDHPVDRVFRWHTRPGALERLLPPWEDVRVADREGGLDDGGTVRVVASKGPVELSMTVKHTAYQEGRLFQDEQVSGPFRRWIHTHRFLPSAHGGCRVEDEVEYEPPLGSAGGIFAGHVIRDELERGFRWRHRRLETDLDHHARADSAPLTVAITGSSGLLGSALRHFLTSGGHRVIRLVRRRDHVGVDAVYWSVREGEVDPGALEGLDAVVHLAGEPIAGLRWTEAKKRAIRRSRVEGTALLAGALAKLGSPPATLVCASGVDYYGDRGNRIVTEETPPGRGFLSEVVREWEAAADPARKAGIRVAHLRQGMVLSPAGGALGTMLLPFKMGVGGRLGSGRQYVSWVDHDDAVGAILHVLTTPGLEGPVNVSSPHPVTNATFTGALGRVLDRPTLVPVPGLVLKAALGEMGTELLLKGARVVPKKLEESGFRFARPALEDSLRFQLGRFED